MAVGARCASRTALTIGRLEFLADRLRNFTWCTERGKSGSEVTVEVEGRRCLGRWIEYVLHNLQMCFNGSHGVGRYAALKFTRSVREITNRTLSSGRSHADALAAGR